MADRPHTFGPTRGFSGMADSMEPCKMLWADPCCHGNDIWPRCGDLSPTGLYVCVLPDGHTTLVFSVLKACILYMQYYDGDHDDNILHIYKGGGLVTCSRWSSLSPSALQRCFPGELRFHVFLVLVFVRSILYLHQQPASHTLCIRVISHFFYVSFAEFTVLAF